MPHEEPPDRVAVASDWKTLPLPQAHAKLNYSRSFQRREWELVKKGIIPVEMEHKWFIYADADRLRFHRSWTGFCIYEARIKDTASGGEIVEAWVNRDPEQYTQDFDPNDKMIDELIEHLLLAR